MKKAGLLLYLIINLLYAQAQDLTFSREKTLMLLHNIDSLMLMYEKYLDLSLESDNITASSNKLLNLFIDSTVTVFDDINPNIEPGRENWIIEKEKSIFDYIQDNKRAYNILSGGIKSTDLGKAHLNIQQNENVLNVPVHVKKDMSGYTKNTPQAYYHTESDLLINFRILDTVDFEMKIDRIYKTGLKSTKWTYQPPEIKDQNWNVIFELIPLYSYNYTEGLNDENIIINETFHGKFGLAGGCHFNYVFNRKNKKYRGISFGLNADIYRGFFKSDYVSSIKNMEDINNDPYYHISEVNNLEEDWHMLSFDVPVRLNFEKWKNSSTGSFFKIGIKASYIPSFNISANGTYSHVGYYPQYNATLRDIHEYNFISDHELDSYESDFPVKDLNYAAELSFGKIWTNRKSKRVFFLGINAGVYINNILTSDSDIYFFDQQNNYTGIAGNYNSLYPVYIGLYLGTRRVGLKELLNQEKNIQYLEYYKE